MSKQQWEAGVLEPGEQGRGLRGEQDQQGLGHGGLKGKVKASVYLYVSREATGRVLAEGRHAGLMPLASVDAYPASPWPAYALIPLSPGFQVIPVCLCVEATLCFWRAC